MTPKINMHNLFFNRRQKEMGTFLIELERYIENSLTQDDEERLAAEDRMAAFFPTLTKERVTWNLIERESGHSRTNDDWKSCGSAIFAFRDDLLQMFLRSDVQNMPISAIQFPYDCFYLYFGDADLFPGFSDEYRVDGLFVQIDSICRQLKHGKVESLEAITSRLEKHYKEMQGYLSRWQKVGGPKAEESIQYWKQRLEEEKDIHACALEELAEQQQKREKYLQLQNDPQSFDYEDKEFGYYSLITAQASIIRRNGSTSPLNPEAILQRPYLTSIYDFDRPWTTIAEAIEKGKKECSGYSADCHFDGLTWDEGGNIVDMYGNAIILETGEWRAEDKTYSNGEPYKEYYRLNNPLNVCNRPELLDTVTRVVFNALCYLNWKDRDVEERYSDPKIQNQIASASRKKQEKLRVKAAQLGYRKLWFCGYNSARAEHSHTGGPVSTHWRRGHWRNQPFGKGLSQTRLTWIRPVIVNKGDDQPDTPTVYRLAKQ